MNKLSEKEKREGKKMTKDKEFVRFNGRVWVSWECQSCGYSCEVNIRQGKEAEDKCDECGLVYKINLVIDAESRKPPANQLVT